MVWSDYQDNTKRPVGSVKNERNFIDAALAHRLEEDLKDIRKQAIEVNLVNDNICHWEVVIEGPSETVYFGYTYTIHLNFPSSFPFKPPKVKFVPCIEHPNVSESGELLIASFLPSGDNRLNALPNEQKWSPAWTAEDIIKRIIKVLEDPDPSMIMNEHAAVLFHMQPEVNDCKKKEEFNTKRSDEQ